jgi:hypothetical protein
MRCLLSTKQCRKLVQAFKPGFAVCLIPASAGWLTPECAGCESPNHARPGAKARLWKTRPKTPKSGLALLAQDLAAFYEVGTGWAASTAPLG